MLTTDLRYKRLLAPVDFSETGRKAFYRAVAFSKHFDAALTILHVREGEDTEGLSSDPAEPTALNDLEAGLARRLDALEAQGQLSGTQRAQIRITVRAGTPWREILRCSVEDHTELIIMGTHGRTGFKHIFMGSQCERVVRQAPCEVLAIKPDGYAPEID